MRAHTGFTLLELLVALGVLAVILGIGLPLLRSDRFAVNQVAQALSSQVTRARLEALRRNTGVGLRVDHTAQRAFLFLDTDMSYSYTTGDTIIASDGLSLAQGDWRAVRLQSSATFVFDPRGFLRDATATTVEVSNSARSFSRRVQVSAQGRSVLL